MPRASTRRSSPGRADRPRRPQRRRTGQGEVNCDAVGVRIANDLVIDAPVRGRIGRGEHGVEAGKALCRRDRVPGEGDAHDDAPGSRSVCRVGPGTVSIRASSWNMPNWFVWARARAGRRRQPSRRGDGHRDPDPPHSCIAEDNRPAQKKLRPGPRSVDRDRRDAAVINPAARPRPGDPDRAARGELHGCGEIAVGVGDRDPLNRLERAAARGLELNARDLRRLTCKVRRPHVAPHLERLALLALRMGQVERDSERVVHRVLGRPVGELEPGVEVARRAAGR